MSDITEIDAMQPQRIDIHHHIIPPFYREAVQRAGLATPIPGVRFPDWDVESALAMMDRQGIATAITSIVEPGVYFGDMAFARELARQCNEFSARLVSDHPRRFGACAVLPLPDVDAALGELEYALDTLKLDGITLLTNYRGAYLGDDAFDPLFAALNRRRTPVFIHPSTPAGRDLPTFGYPVAMYEFTFDTTRMVAHLLYGGALARYPDLRLILSHGGGTAPFLAGRLVLAAQVAPPLREHAPVDIIGALQRLYYDLTSAATPYALSALNALVEPTQLLFGTDWPFVPEPYVAENTAGIAQYRGFDRQSRQAIERENALRLFPDLARRLPESRNNETIPLAKGDTK